MSLMTFFFFPLLSPFATASPAFACSPYLPLCVSIFAYLCELWTVMWCVIVWCGCRMHASNHQETDIRKKFFRSIDDASNIVECQRFDIYFLFLRLTVMRFSLLDLAVVHEKTMRRRKPKKKKNNVDLTTGMWLVWARKSLANWEMVCGVWFRTTAIVVHLRGRIPKHKTQKTHTHTHSRHTREFHFGLSSALSPSTDIWQDNELRGMSKSNAKIIAIHQRDGFLSPRAIHSTHTHTHTHSMIW